MEKKIDIDDKNEAIESKIETFCSGLKKMPFFSAWTMVSEEKKLKLVKSDIISNLFSDLEGKNKFTDDQDVCNKTQIYYKALEIYQLYQQSNNLNEKVHFTLWTGETVADVRNNPPSFYNYQSKFKEMTNREFLKKFVTQTINLNKQFRAMPAWKRICYAFLGFVAAISGISNLILGISSGSKLLCFLGFLIMCAWAGLICSLVFHLSLAVLIPSAIILGLVTIYVSVATVKLQMTIYEVRQEKGTDIDGFFNLVGEINQYLDTHGLQPDKISSGEENSKKPSINEKIRDENAKKNNKEESDIKTKKSNDEKDEK